MGNNQYAVFGAAGAVGKALAAQLAGRAKELKLPPQQAPGGRVRSDVTCD